MKRTFIRLFLLITFLSTATLFSYSQGIGSGGIGKPQVKPILSAEQIAKQYLPGVTLIVCDDGKGNYSQGSGFFVAPGMILTNAHVVKGMVRGVVITGKEQKKNLINAVAYFNFENTDLALLVSDEAKKAKIPLLPLAQPNDLSIGETVYVLSNPKGLSGTISQGIVSSEVRKTKKMDLLQITAPISAGSSGGAVMNSRGEVIGIATSSLESGQNLNFAVPAARIGQFLDEFLTLPNPPEYVSLNKITGSWIAPKSFWNESGNSKKDESSITKDNNKSIFTERATWLINKISAMRGYTDDINFFEYKNVSINGCNLSFSELQINSQGIVWMINSYSEISLKSLVSVGASPDNSNTPLVIFDLGEKATGKSQFYRSGYDKSKEPDSTSIKMENSIVLFTGNQTTSKQIANVIGDLAKLCEQ